MMSEEAKKKMSERMKGNKYAAKCDDTASRVNLNIRTTKKERARWRAQAVREGLSLTDWVRMKLNGMNEYM
jgi:predicted HicB family RNase H-like nuclease